MLAVRLMPLGSQATPMHLRGWLEDPNTGDTLLEFHNTATVNEEVLAFAALMPEILDFLHLSKHEFKLADLLLDRLYQVRLLLESDAAPKKVAAG